MERCIVGFGLFFCGFVIGSTFLFVLIVALS